ncbi:MAG: LysR family transcriptional regulator [Bacteroidota bacterium]|jgi:LysR family nitrogen assimilation transcriptional regulator
MLDLRQLRYFFQVAETGSFSRAAAALSIAQSALSRQIRKLENDLGMPLLYRHGRGVTLTAEGDKLLADAKPLLARLEQIKQELRAGRKAVRGAVKMGLPPSISSVLSAPLLQEFRANYPDASLRIIDGFSVHIHEWLVSGRLDFAIYYAEGNNSSLHTEPLIAENLYLFGPNKRQGPFARGRRMTISFHELANLPLVLPAAQHGLRRRIDRAAARKRMKLRIEIELDAVAALKDMVQSGGGYSIMNYGGIAAEVEAGMFNACKIVSPTIEHTMCLATSPHQAMTVATREAIRLAHRSIQALLAARKLRGRSLSRSLGKPSRSH